MKRCLLLLTCFLVAAASFAVAQDKYQTPPQDVVDLYLAKPVPKAIFNVDATRAVVTERSSQFRSLQEMVAMDEYKIGGIRIDGRNFSESRYRTLITNLYLISVPAGIPTQVLGLPAEAHLFEIRWSPSGRYFAFLNYTDREVELYRVDATAAQPEAVKVNARKVNAIFGSSYAFLDDGRILYKSVPDGIGEIPSDKLPEGPVIQRSDKKKGSYRTYQDLIKTQSDEQRYDYFCTSIFAIWNAADNSTRTIGKPGIVRSYSLSPDRSYMMVTTEHKPYSYVRTHSSFPSRLFIEDMDGNTVKVLRSPMTPKPKTDAVPKKPRKADKPKVEKPRKPSKSQYAWRADLPATLTWIETAPGAKGGAPDDGMDWLDRLRRDEEEADKDKEEPRYETSLWQCAAPFNLDEDKVMLLRSEYRLRDIIWGNDRMAVYTDFSAKQKIRRTLLFNPSDTAQAPKVLITESTDHDTLGVFPVYGKPCTVRNAYGREVLLTDAKGTFLLFSGNNRRDAEGDPMAFVDCLNLKNGKTVNLWTGKAPYDEQITSILGSTASKVKFISVKQSTKEVPNYFSVEARPKGKVKATQITRFENPLPQLAAVQDTFVTYTRKDGVKLTSRLFLPAGYNPETDGKLPVMMWTYPYEYRCAAEAEKRRQERYSFPVPSRTVLIAWATKGYAVMQGFSMPIISKTVKSQPNDDFLNQLVMNAEAAIDFLDNAGIGDRNRVAVGGHSYGSFMTVNLMAHSKLFKAGLAESGAFNRSLTPFGFQSENRTYWKARKVYDRMSPFNYADSISGHILFVHGMMDENTGTHPIQSERMYQAAAGAGKDVDYLQLPYEGHGYIFKENLLHLFSEFYNMLEKYVKNAKPADEKPVEAPETK